MKITQKVLDRANDIYLDMFADDMCLGNTKQDLFRCESVEDFESFREILSAGQFDAIEAALMEDTGTIFGGLK